MTHKTRAAEKETPGGKSAKCTVSRKNWFRSLYIFLNKQKSWVNVEYTVFFFLHKYLSNMNRKVYL